MSIILDFETRSLANLKKVGAAVYARDPSTEIICLCWESATTDARGTWLPGEPPEQTQLWQEIRAGRRLVAHGCNFEKSIWREKMEPEYGWPSVFDPQWDDTQAVAAQRCLPLALETLTQELALPYAKDMEGNKLTLSLSRPNRKGMLPEVTPEIQARVVRYCNRDVRAQKAVYTALGDLPSSERQVWLLSERMNQRGFHIDRPLVLAMQSVVEKAAGPLAEEFAEITDGLKYTQVAKVVEWCKENGYEIPNLQAETLAEALGRSPDCSPDDLDGRSDSIPDAVRRALEIRQLAGSAAIKKLPRALQCMDEFGVIRYGSQYNGAATGRFAGRLLQPHNFPRPDNDHPTDPAMIDFLIEILRTGHPELVELHFGPAIDTVVSSLRHIITPREGRALTVGDFGQIEVRTLMAIVGQKDKLALLAESGSKVYCDMAQSIYGRPITKADLAEYTIGKNTVLGAGFGMGDSKFQWKYAPKQPLSFCSEVIRVYRKEWAPAVPEFWYDLEEACTRAVWDRKPWELNGLRMQLEACGSLTIRLPSGRKLYYPQATAEREEAPWGAKQTWSYRATKNGRARGVWPYGGLLAENVASGMARDLLVHAMFKCEREKLPVVLTVHDEIVSEPLTGDADAAKLKQIMEDRPPWAVALELPVAAECWTGDRYRK